METLDPHLPTFSQLPFTYSKSPIETQEKSEICAKLTIKTSEQRQLYHYGVVIVNFELISNIILMFPFLP